MARTKRKSSVRIEPPLELVGENELARRQIEYYRSHGYTHKTIWHDILERTNKALEEFKKPITIREVENG